MNEATQLLARALKMMQMAGYGVAPHDADHNNPVIAWMAEARELLAQNPVQRQGADSPTSATIDPSADQDHAPARNNVLSTVGALQEATETPRVQSAPATLPWCGCKGPWCEGRDRDAKVKCLGYQIDSDGMAGVGACAMCGAPQEVADPLVARIERMRGAIAAARSRIVQHWPDGPVRGSVIAFLDQAAFGREHPARCFNTFPGATMCEFCGGDLERKP